MKLFASVAPGNIRSLRCLLGAGFHRIGAERLFAFGPVA
jgi:RimJ/RimL family protein N-acetyltransferase